MIIIRTAVNLVMGIGTAILLSLIGVEYAIFWGFLAFLLGFIPYVGFWLAVLPPALLAWFQIGPPAAIAVVAGCCVINVLVEYVLFPNIAGRSLSLSPAVVFISLIFWGAHRRCRDGLRSVVARRLGVRRQGWPRRMAFVAHVADVPGLEDRAEMHVGAEGYVGLNPLGHGLVNVALVVPESLVLAARGRAEAFFLDRLATFPGVRGRVRREAIRRRVLVTGPFAAWSRWVTGNGGTAHRRRRGLL